MKKVFLGGTCNGSEWREHLKPLLNIDYFDPVVKDWTPECQAEELQQRSMCDFLLYVITPSMTGVYSIAEVVDDSNKRPEKTILCVLDIVETGGWFTKGQLTSLNMVKDLVKANGGHICRSLIEVAAYLNRKVTND
jgi:hypothetical protein